MTKTGARRIALLAVSLLAISFLAMAREAEKAQLGGRWKFNPQVSDDGQQKLRAAQQNNHPDSGLHDHTYPGAPAGRTSGYPGVGTDTPVPGGGVSVGDPEGIGRGGEGTPVGTDSTPVIYPGGTDSDPGTRGGRGAQGQQSNRGVPPANPRWNWLTRNPAFLQIDQHARQIAVTDDAGSVHTYFPDGRKHEEKDAKGNKIWTKAQWEGNSLVAETRLSPSEILTETFRRSEDRHQIYVKTRFESPSLGAAVNIRRVYDLVKSPPDH